jgi:peptidyl-tRNA hydrolase, PTH1 family
MSKEDAALIVGLGNPGKDYALTRHNLGWRVVKKFGLKRSWNFQKKSTLQGRIASGDWNGRKRVFLLLPTTYMNLSGLAVSSTCRFYNLEKKEILVVSDDATLSFGTLRYRPKGSCGGHNGLKNIEKELGTQDYPRLRIGIGHPLNGEFLPFVLGSFTKEEEALLASVITRADHWIANWVDADEKERSFSETVEFMPNSQND